MKGYLLIVGTGLNDDIATSVFVLQLLLWKWRQITEELGTFSFQAQFLEKGSRNPKRQAQAIGIQSYCFTCICWRQEGIGAIFFNQLPFD